MTAPAKKSSVESLPDRIFKDPDSDLFYSYQVVRETPQKKFFVCSLKISNGCNGQGNLDLNGIFRYTEEKDEDAPKYRHNHVGEANLLEDAMFLKQMHTLLCHSFLTNVAVYNKLKILYPNAAVKYPFQRVSMRMRQWRLKRKLPELTHGLSTLVDLVSNDLEWKNLKTHDKGSMVIKPITTYENELCGVAVADMDFLATVKASLYKFIYFEEIPIKLGEIDGTCIIIIMTVPHRNHSFPGSWTALTKDSLQDYDRLVRNGLSKVLGVIQPETIYYDFNNKLFTALQLRYPATRLKGTFDAYCYLLYTNAMETINLRARHAENEVRVFTKILLLAFLPPELIVPTFIQVVQNLSPQLFQTFELFLMYYFSQWLNKVGASNISFHNDLEALSNCTKVHCNRLQNMSGFQPNTWSFLESTISIQLQSYRDMDKLAKKKAVSSGTSPVGKLIDVPKIKRLQDLLESGEIKELEFLSRGVRVAEQLVRNLIFMNPGHKSGFEIVDIVPIHHKLSTTIARLREMEPEAPELLIFGEINVANDNENNGEGESDEESENEVNQLGVNNGNEQIHEQDLGEMSEDENANLEAAAGGFFYHSSICLACSDEESPPDVVYNPCRHCIFCQPCQRQYVQSLLRDGQILTCSYCRQEVESVDLII